MVGRMVRSRPSCVNSECEMCTVQQATCQVLSGVQYHLVFATVSQALGLQALNTLNHCTLSYTSHKRQFFQQGRHGRHPVVRLLHQVPARPHAPSSVPQGNTEAGY